MKLTKNQKHFLKTIKDKNVRKYQKQQFKLQNQFDSVIVFSDNIFKPRNKTIGDFLSQHPLKGILFKEEFEKVNGKGFPWHEHNVKEVEERFNELAKKYIPKERIEDLIYFDFANTDYPIGFNMFDAQTEDERDIVTNDITEMFVSMYGHEIF